MQAESYQLMATLVPIGLGLLLLGIANLSLRDFRPWVKAVVSLAVVAFVSSLTFPLNVPQHITVTVAGVVTGAALAVTMAGSAQVVAALANLIQTVIKPAWRWGALAAFGAGIVSVSLYKYEADEEASLDEEMSAMQQLAWKPVLHNATDSLVATDAGNAVELQEPDTRRDTAEMAHLERRILDQMSFGFAVIRQNGVDDGANCHGWVFTGGKYWLGPDMVTKILNENGYRPVSVPLVGDVAVYFDHDQVAHTAVVKYLGDDAPIVEGKWGWMGVFLHPADQSPYGQSITYYHSDRANHLLVGLGGKANRNATAVEPTRAPTRQ